MKCEVAILMACYNAEKTLRLAMESILNQSFGAFEFIIVDDGSNDATWEIIEAMAKNDGRLKIERNERNIGLAASLNKGLEMTQAKWILRMDSDDWSYPNRLEKQLNYVNQYPEVDILGTGIECIDKAGKSLGTRFLKEHHDAIVTDLFKKPLVYHPTILIKRSVFEMHGFYDPELRWAEDADFWYRIYDKVKFHNLQEALLKYRVKDSLNLRIVKNNFNVKYRNLRRRSMLLSHGQYLLRDLLFQSIKIIFRW